MCDKITLHAKAKEGSANTFASISTIWPQKHMQICAVNTHQQGGRRNGHYLWNPGGCVLKWRRRMRLAKMRSKRQFLSVWNARPVVTSSGLHITCLLTTYLTVPKYATKWWICIANRWAWRHRLKSTLCLKTAIKFVYIIHTHLEGGHIAFYNSCT